MKALRQHPLAQPSLAAGSPGIRARGSEVSAPDVEQGCSPHPQARKPALHRQRGIALVVTLILLSVVTFLAVAFLFLARRERGAVATSVQQTVARRASEAATERAKAEAIASIIATTNQFNYGLRVSVNYINPDGFKSGSFSLTNINYDYKADASAFSADDRNQNIANLFYSPRPPVFVRTNEFPFYLDLNRNQRFDTNGLLPVIDYNGLAITVATTNGPLILSNSFVGDPEWIGVLERPDQPHSAKNKFVARYCYIVAPSGMALDVNASHNQAKLPGLKAQDGFSRNMGVSPFEMNLGAFLVDLNTNAWNAGGWPNYFYNTNPAVPSTGTAFEDARDIVRYRYNYDWANLRSVSTLFGAAGANAFRTDLMDGYGRGPYMAGPNLPTLDADQINNNVGFGWPGAENPNHYFTTQDFFDPNKNSLGFYTRLRSAGYGVSYYDRYTYYRMLSQLGTDSGPEPANKLHLNYVNVLNRAVVPDAQTNFVAWGTLQFFTNAADRLLQATFPVAGLNVRDFGVNAPLSVTNIPVLVSNHFVYTPALHRVFQLAANITDASTNYTVQRGADLPSVFRPKFRKQPNGFNPAITDIYIDGWVEDGGVTAYLNKPLDLNDPADLATVGGVPDQNIYGVPWVIGAKKGYPNFNEFAMQSISQITRKLQVVRPTVTARATSTNQLFMLGVSNVFAFEAWNSYQTNYNRAVSVIVANDMSIGLTYTNDPVLDPRGGGSTVRLTVGAVTNFTVPGAWPGYGSRLDPAKTSFVVPLQTNITFLPDSFFRTKAAPAFSTNMNDRVGLLRGFETAAGFLLPQFNFSVSNRIRFIMLDTATGRVIDYVQLNDLNGVRNLSAELSTSDTTIYLDGRAGGLDQLFWQTNRPGVQSLASPPQGVLNQIEASLGNIQVADWNSYGVGQAAGQLKEKEIDGFRVFMGLTPLRFPQTVNTNTIMQVPFTPTRKESQYITWQANDPLVHYTAADLNTLAQGTGLRRETPNGPIQPIPNIGDLNKRFEPWGGYPKSGSGSSPTADPYSLAVKDPGVRASDDWDFPADKYATVGWLGRVHRGTPWQTLYLKSEDVSVNAWIKWSGNSNVLDAAFARPVNDRVVFDVFTTAIDQNATRGQLSMNQTGLAAWSAFFGGVIGLTNSASDAALNGGGLPVLEPMIIPPAAVDNAGQPVDPLYSPLAIIHNGINRTRAAQPGGVFRSVGDLLAVPELTVGSPLLNTNSTTQLRNGLTDAAYERLPQMLLGLLRGNDQTRFTIYAYGQSLKPANNSVVRASGPYFGLCTNYQVTAEFATRTVVRLETTTNSATGRLQANSVNESFNVLSPE